MIKSVKLKEKNITSKSKNKSIHHTVFGHVGGHPDQFVIRVGVVSFDAVAHFTHHCIPHVTRKRHLNRVLGVRSGDGTHGDDCGWWWS